MPAKVTSANNTVAMARGYLVAERPVTSWASYQSQGGGSAYEKALDSHATQVIAAIRAAGLRGRGGAGFPTAIKWQTVRDSPATTKYVICNAGEGEPGTFKDRWLLRNNPYQVIEGLAIAMYAVGAKQAYIGIKAGFDSEIAATQRAVDEMRAVGIADGIEVVPGPDEYLFGEEKAMLEVLEGGLPLPRVFPPYVHGLFAATYGGPSERENNPTVVNNVETLAHVTHIIDHGATWFRSFGIAETPGTMIFTISGDVQRPCVRELPLGVTLRQLIDDVAGGLGPGRRVKAIFPGVANAVITERLLDVPLGFDTMRAAGSSLGSAGFIVYDDTACMVKATSNFSRFLHIESCNQCVPCKLGSGEITERLERLLAGTAERRDLDEIGEIAAWVTNGQRCYLATSEQLLAWSVIDALPEDFRAHVEGTCRLRHDLVLPKIIDYVPEQGFVFDSFYDRKQPDWTYQLS